MPTKPNKKNGVIHIENVPELKESISNIADNLGEDLSSLIKSKLREVINSYPPNMRLPNKGIKLD